MGKTRITHFGKSPERQRQLKEKKKRIKTKIEEKERERDIHAENHVAEIMALINRAKHAKPADVNVAQKKYILKLVRDRAHPKVIEHYQNMPVEQFRIDWITHFIRRLGYQGGHSKETLNQ